ncbi:hypothetical protein ACFFV7_36105 [Nonomuraea spiralis]|uniref:Uncharacterized protein n=1 Tax=Nonomuraea spiralis TaxID=46182 RepID=A0ABV5IRM6_9ACTN|nr:hypothetical protein [Nonomuraea spiralis]GGT11583.1 hypothetical protein GCM10010176_065350 [Nonomuraea spiralis]
MTTTLRWPTAWIREQIDQMDWSPAYRNKHLAALRGVLKEAWKLGLLSTDDHQRAVALAPFGGHREPTGQHVPDIVIGRGDKQRRIPVNSSAARRPPPRPHRHAPAVHHARAAAT